MNTSSCGGNWKLLFCIWDQGFQAIMSTDSTSMFIALKLLAMSKHGSRINRVEKKSPCQGALSFLWFMWKNISCRLLALWYPLCPLFKAMGFTEGQHSTGCWCLEIFCPGFVQVFSDLLAIDIRCHRNPAWVLFMPREQVVSSGRKEHP